MKKIIILFLSTVLILTSLSSCASFFDYFGVLENAGTEYSKESEVINWISSKQMRKSFL